MSEHNHEHKGGCCGGGGGCCGHHDHGHHHPHHHHDHPHHRPPVAVDSNLSQNQVDFLAQLIHYQYLPVAQFVARSSTQSDFEVLALSPVFIRATDDTMELVKEAGEFLSQLELQGMITLDYDVPLDGYHYEEYHQSAVYTYFCQTVEEAKALPNALGDTPSLVLGSMAPTQAALYLLSKKD